MGKTTAPKGAYVVKDGIRHKDVYATAVGDITKAYFLSVNLYSNTAAISLHYVQKTHQLPDQLLSC